MYYMDFILNSVWINMRVWDIFCDKCSLYKNMAIPDWNQKKNQNIKAQCFLALKFAKIVDV